MNKLLSIVFCAIATLTLAAQSKKELAVKDFFWGASDYYKNSTEIPEKWKNESAVILYKNVNYDFHKYSRNITYTTSSRQRIKLLDKSAVKEFSEFKFSDLFVPPSKVVVFPIPVAFNIKQKQNSFAGVKIIKPDGTEIEIDIKNESVQEDGTTKLAISNLEVGDIIDYYYYNEEHKYSNIYGFDPVENTLSEDYPIVNFKLFFETENNFFINFNSFNNAPDLKEIPTKKRSIRRYELDAENIDKYTSNRWFYPLVELPSYKFQVYFARSGKFEDRALAFLPEKENIIKTNVTEAEVLDLYDHRFKAEGDIGDARDFLKTHTFKNDYEKVVATYNYMRHFYLTRFIEAFYVYESKIHYSPFSYYENNPVFIQTDIRFVRHFTAFLKKEKIGYDIIICKKRYDGTIDQLLIEKNTEVLIKVNTKQPLYIDFFGPHTTVNGFSPLLENTEAYALTKTKNKIDGIKKIKLPVSTYEQNDSERITKVTLNDDFSSASLEITNHLKGHQKLNAQKNLLLLNEYVNEDYKKYNTSSFIERVKGKKKKVILKKKIDALLEDLKTKRNQKTEDALKEEFEFNTIENYTFNIKETGRYNFNDNFTYVETFDVKNELVKKAGRNFIVEIGKLLTQQINLSEKTRHRKENVYMSYARSYNNKITLNIPEGYTISGIDKLNKNIDNETGAFVSKATISNDKLIITTSKHYKHNYEPHANWNLMVAFLDAAHQFTNEKILLKKK